MSIIDKHLTSLGHQCLIYADDMVVFTSNKLLNLVVEYLNSSLKDLKTILNKVYFEVAPEKCNPVIFTRSRYIAPLTSITITKSFPLSPMSLIWASY